MCHSLWTLQRPRWIHGPGPAVSSAGTTPPESTQASSRWRPAQRSSSSSTLRGGLSLRWAHLKAVRAAGVCLLPDTPREVWFSAVLAAATPRNLLVVAEKGASIHEWVRPASSRKATPPAPLRERLLAVRFRLSTAARPSASSQPATVPPPAARPTPARRPRVQCTGPPPRAPLWPPTMPTHQACSTTCSLRVPPFFFKPGLPTHRAPSAAAPPPHAHACTGPYQIVVLIASSSDTTTMSTHRTQQACIKNHLSSQRANLGRVYNRLMLPSSMHVRVRVGAPKGTPAQLNAQGWSPSSSASGACKTRLPFAAADTAAASFDRSPPHARAWRLNTGASSVG